MSEVGRLIGVGVGPGDPELLTLKAVRALAEADVLAFFAKAGNRSNARDVVATHLRPGLPELALLYPVTTEIDRHDDRYKSTITAFYEQATATIAGHLDLGRTVAVLSEGDPLFYGSYMHIHVRLADRYPTEIVPGVTGMSGSWSAAGTSIAQGDDIMTVLPGTLDEEKLAARFADTDAAVVMKLGRNLAKVRRALATAGKLDRAIYVERATTATAATIRLADKPDDVAPYFSIVLVPGWAGRS